jgi:hypothetical protein
MENRPEGLIRNAEEEEQKEDLISLHTDIKLRHFFGTELYPLKLLPLLRIHLIFLVQRYAVFHLAPGSLQRDERHTSQAYT